MYKVKSTRRNTKRASSPIRPAPAPAPISDVEPAEVKPVEERKNELVESESKSDSLEKKMVNFFEAESAAVSLTKPWLRLERGLRLQKYRAFAESYPGLNKEEKEALYRVLVKANDAKLLNTKQQIQYENGVIHSIKCLKMIRSGDGNSPATFKIDVLRSTKKNLED
jgi:hypothetical protein